MNDLWIVPTDGGTPPRRLTSSRAAESGVEWAPDSRRIAFATRREGDDVEQIYLLPVDGGEARRLTTLPTGASNPKWRRDGRAILFESMLKADRPAPEKSTARVFDTLPIRFWNVWNDGSRPHLFVQTLDGGAAVDWLAGTALAASPDFDAPYVGSRRRPIAAGAVVARRPGDRLCRHRQPHHDDDGGDRVAPVPHPERGRRAGADDEDGRELRQAAVFAGWHGCWSRRARARRRAPHSTA